MGSTFRVSWSNRENVCKKIKQGHLSSCKNGIRSNRTSCTIKNEWKYRFKKTARAKDGFTIIGDRSQDFEYPKSKANQ